MKRTQSEVPVSGSTKSHPRRRQQPGAGVQGGGRQSLVHRQSQRTPNHRCRRQRVYRLRLLLGTDDLWSRSSQDCGRGQQAGAVGDQFRRADRVGNRTGSKGGGGCAVHRERAAGQLGDRSRRSAHCGWPAGLPGATRSSNSKAVITVTATACW